MITRIWHGKTSLEKAAAYLNFLLDDGTNEYLQTQGNLSVKIGQRKEKDCCHFWTITEWSDIKSIKAFAGMDYERAKYYPQDEEFLLEFEERVIHFETYAVKIIP
jgi:hypothetical protein